MFPEGVGVEGTPPGYIGYEEHLAGSKGLHMNFAFVADVPTRTLAECDEYDEVIWVGRRQRGRAGLPAQRQGAGAPWPWPHPARRST